MDSVKWRAHRKDTVKWPDRRARPSARVIRGRQLCVVRLSMDFVGEVINGRWAILRLIAGGGFGHVYEGRDIEQGDACAVKTEATKAERPVLRMEAMVLRAYMHASEHSCQLLDEGVVSGRATFVVMTLLDRNLYDLQRSRPNRHFEKKTVARIAIQCVEAIRDLHQVGFVHRDIKPANFAIGRTQATRRTVHLVDFGLARAYWIRGTNSVRPPRQTAGFKGTLRYASIAAHCQQELGRRDDLCSLIYSLVEMWNGAVPWREVHEGRAVATMKKAAGIDRLMRGLEWQYARIGRHVISLRYADEPDYESYLQWLKGMQRENGYRPDGPFEWE